MSEMIDKAREFVEWLELLKQVTADKTGLPLYEIEVNEETAYNYFKDGYTPTQCFREEW